MLQQLSILLYAGSLLAASPAVAPNSPTASADPTTIHRRVEEVRLTFSVDGNNGPAKALPAESFRFYDNAQVVAPTAFSADSNLPLHIGLLVDRSDSVRKEFSAEQAAAQHFLQAVLRPEVDSVFLLDFTHQLNFRRPVIGDPNLLSEQVSALAPGGQTALYDAMFAAAHYDLMTTPDAQPVRKAVVLLSDGEDNYSLHSLADAIASAQKMDVTIYAVTIHPARGFYSGDGVLAALADETGGRAFVLPNLKNLDAVFAKIQDDLRSEYFVSFHPAASRPCGYHSLSVKPLDSKLHVRARHGYFACEL